MTTQAEMTENLFRNWEDIRERAKYLTEKRLGKKTEVKYHTQQISYCRLNWVIVDSDKEVVTKSKIFTSLSDASRHAVMRGLSYYSIERC